MLAFVLRERTCTEPGGKMGRRIGTGLAGGVTIAVLLVLNVASGATTARHALTYSATVGSVPMSQRVRHTFHVSNDTTVRPPKSARVRVSQLAALGGHQPAPELNVNGKTVYPTVLLGILTNSVIQPACDLPGLTIPGPSGVPGTTPCPHPGLTYQHDLVWVIEYRGVYPRSSGGPALPPGVTTTSTVPLKTTTVIPVHSGTFTYVSAITGKILYSEN
jgi:hypothetical protein